MQRGESPSLQGQKWSRDLQETVDTADLDRGYDIPPTVLHWTVWTLRTSDSMAVEIRQQLRHLTQPQDPRQQGQDSYLSTRPLQYSSSKICPLTYSVLDTRCTGTTEQQFKKRVTMCNPGGDQGSFLREGCWVTGQ